MPVRKFHPDDVIPAGAICSAPEIDPDLWRLTVRVPAGDIWVKGTIMRPVHGNGWRPLTRKDTPRAGDYMLLSEAVGRGGKLILPARPLPEATYLYMGRRDHPSQA